MRARWISLVAMGLAVCGLLATRAPVFAGTDPEAVERLAARWVAAVAARDPAFVDLLDGSGRAYYTGLQQLALRGDARELDPLHPADQIQVMLLRLLVPPKALKRMDEAELLRFALDQGLIGVDLREGDVLREIVVDGSEARGRLYKFGRADRPDRGLQYFTREAGDWRVELRGELERTRADFDAFVARSGLPASEAAFFILEMRLMRKVTPADFVPPLARGSTSPEGARPLPSDRASRLRVVSTRLSLDSSLTPAATLEDREQSLRYVLELGDVLPDAPALRLTRVAAEAVVLSTSEGNIELRLDAAGPALGRRELPSDAVSLMEVASQGEGREGWMAQWRNVGLRDRPLLLQQASLTPDYAKAAGAGGEMLGLRVRRVARGSFWHQLGLEQGDRLTVVGDRSINSMDAWRHLIDVAQNEQVVTIALERDGRRFRFRTRTIPPR